MASNKSNGGRRSIAPSVLSALTITPAIIKAVEELIDKLPDMPSKVSVPQLYGLGFPLKLDQAVTMLTNAGLIAMPSELDIKEADLKYRNCVDSEVVGSNTNPKQKVDVGFTVIVRYITREVIDESQRIFDEMKRQQLEIKRVKAEKRSQRIGHVQKIAVDISDKAKNRFVKILPHK